MEEEEIESLMRGVKMLGIDASLISEEQLHDIIHIVCKEEKKNEKE